MHTPEPWKYSGEEDGDFVVWGPAPDDSFIGNVGSNFKQVGVIVDLDRDNARRVVACVNAFEGIDINKFEGKSVAEYLTSQTMLKHMGPDERGGFGMELEGGACRLLANAFAEQFKEAGAVNFLEVNFTSDTLGPISVIMQRSQGKTPGSILSEARAQRDELLVALKKANEFITNGIDLGYIRMPDADVPDSAHQTPALIMAAIAKCENS